MKLITKHKKMIRFIRGGNTVVRKNRLLIGVLVLIGGISIQFLVNLI
jgi:hypothetical protein